MLYSESLDVLNLSMFKTYILLTFVFTCILQRSAIDIANSINEMYEFDEYNPIMIWLPVVEPDLGQERFLTDDPTRLYQLGQFNRIPVMAGITELEFAYLAISKYNY